MFCTRRLQFVTPNVSQDSRIPSITKKGVCIILSNIHARATQRFVHHTLTSSHVCHTYLFDITSSHPHCPIPYISLFPSPQIYNPTTSPKIAIPNPIPSTGYPAILPAAAVEGVAAAADDEAAEVEASLADEEEAAAAAVPVSVLLAALVMDIVPVDVPEDALPVLSAPGAQVAFVGRSLTPWPEQRESAKEMTATGRTISKTRLQV